MNWNYALNMIQHMLVLNISLKLLLFEEFSEIISRSLCQLLTKISINDIILFSSVLA